jgi:phosphoserine phosphatase
MTDALPWKLVTIDIDGTLTLVHGWRFLAERLGRLPDYERTNRRFYLREIGEDEHLRDLLKLAVGHRLDAIEAILAATPKLSGISETVQAFHTRGVQVALLTHNPAYVCEWYRRQFGFDLFSATSGAAVRDHRIAPVPPVHANKEQGLRDLMGRAGVFRSQVVHVGDGWADAEIFPRVGGGVALNSHLPEVEEAADLALRLTDLRPLVGSLDRLEPRKTVNDE